ncbi:hypothetical protein ACIQH5_01500 [Paenarthrobacter sp. NPDC091711]|uniref:hypothetical protein n=1 Tax=Paenarthrobacter sp. NPDC091711 TaxID=3364385 RepID=UPI00381139DB
MTASGQGEPDGYPSPFHEILHLDLYGDDPTRIANVTSTADYSTEQEQPDMSTLDEAIKQLLAIEGSTGAAVVDYSSGMALAQGGNPGFDLGVAAAGNSNVVSAKLRTMADLSLDSDIEDILITLGTQYHLINVLNSTASKGLFVYLVLDRTYANLALARHKLKNLAKDITI